MIDLSIQENRSYLVHYIIWLYHQHYGGLRGKYQVQKTIWIALYGHELGDEHAVQGLEYTRRHFPFFEEGLAAEVDLLVRKGRLKQAGRRLTIPDQLKAYYKGMKDRFLEILHLEGDTDDFTFVESLQDAVLRFGHLSLNEIEKRFEVKAGRIPERMKVREFLEDKE